jgi:hypothetical protein
MPDCDNDSAGLRLAWPPRVIAGREVSTESPIDLCSLCAGDLEDVNPGMFCGVRTYGRQAEPSGPVTYDLA